MEYNTPDYDLCRAAFSIDEEGVLRWQSCKYTPRLLGTVAGKVKQTSKYTKALLVTFHRSTYHVDRICWMLYHGRQLSRWESVTHADGNRLNNRKENLVLCGIVRRHRGRVSPLRGIKLGRKQILIPPAHGGVRTPSLPMCYKFFEITDASRLVWKLPVNSRSAHTYAGSWTTSKHDRIAADRVGLCGRQYSVARIMWQMYNDRELLDTESVIHIDYDQLNNARWNLKAVTGNARLACNRVDIFKPWEKPSNWEILLTGLADTIAEFRADPSKFVD